MDMNIFENAKFGDKFKTRKGNIAIYIESYMSGDVLTHYLVQKGLKEPMIQCYDDGQNCMNHKEWKEKLFPDYVQHDIVGKWEEQVNEEKLDKLVHEAYPFEDDDHHWNWKLKKSKLDYTIFREPDLDNKITALALVDDGKRFKHLKLLGK